LSVTTPDLVKVGAFVVLVGFLTVGYASLYLATAPTPTTPATPEDALRAQGIAKNAEIAQGLGWMVVGIGFFTAFLGVVRSDYAIDSKIETVLARLPKK
jgi:hypothetical protein